MPVLRILALVGAGVGGGLAGSVAGLASLVSYPALLALGLNPIGANVTNTVALVFGGAGSALGSRPEMVGQGRRLGRLGAAGGAGRLGRPRGAVADRARVGHDPRRVPPCRRRRRRGAP
jgi:hypothetical protein